MKNSFETLGNHIHREATTRSLEEVIRTGDMRMVAKEYVKMIGVELSYENSEDKDFNVSREKLNSEPGLIIANHPGYVDFPMILDTLARDDVKFVAAGGTAEYVKKVFGPSVEKHVLSTRSTKNTNFQSYRSFIPDIAQYINEERGVVVLFPTGGDDQNGEKIVFQSAFRRVLEQMKSQDMVYEFFISPSDVEGVSASKGKLIAGILSQAYISPAANINKLQKNTVRVYEKYTTAEEWQDILQQDSENTSVKEQNAMLADHYVESFGGKQ
jgi:hypothetical protein